MARKERLDPSEYNERFPFVAIEKDPEQRARLILALTYGDRSTASHILQNYRSHSQLRPALKDSALTGRITQFAARLSSEERDQPEFKSDAAYVHKLQTTPEPLPNEKLSQVQDEVFAQLIKRVPHIFALRSPKTAPLIYVALSASKPMDFGMLARVLNQELGADMNYALLSHWVEQEGIPRLLERLKSQGNYGLPLSDGVIAIAEERLRVLVSHARGQVRDALYNRRSSDTAESAPLDEFYWGLVAAFMQRMGDTTKEQIGSRASATLLSAISVERRFQFFEERKDAHSREQLLAHAKERASPQAIQTAEQIIEMAAPMVDLRTRWTMYFSDPSVINERRSRVLRRVCNETYRSTVRSISGREHTSRYFHNVRTLDTEISSARGIIPTIAVQLDRPLQFAPGSDKVIHDREYAELVSFLQSEREDLISRIEGPFIRACLSLNEKARRIIVQGPDPNAPGERTTIMDVLFDPRIKRWSEVASR